VTALAEALVGNELGELCARYDSFDGEPASFCLGYVLGVHEMAAERSPGYCNLKGVTNNQIVLVVAKYLKDNPAKLHIEATTLVLTALRDAFPCTEGN